MKNMLKLAVLLLVVGLFLPTAVYAENPIVQTIYTADPAPMVYNGVCYVYTGHDEDKLENDFFTMKDWRCYSSTDMVNWTDLGSPLAYTDFSWAKGDAWAALPESWWELARSQEQAAGRPGLRKPAL